MGVSDVTPMGASRGLAGGEGDINSCKNPDTTAPGKNPNDFSETPKGDVLDIASSNGKANELLNLVSVAVQQAESKKG